VLILTTRDIAGIRGDIVGFVMVRICRLGLDEIALAIAGAVIDVRNLFSTSGHI